MTVESPPIIVKKIKKGGHGHHGGAWKVAFADFVTAMMAFFMLLWLLGSTTPEQKAGIADYMNDPAASEGPGGAGANPTLEGGAGILDGKGAAPFQQFEAGESDAPATSAEVTGNDARTTEETAKKTADTAQMKIEQAEKAAKEAENKRLESLLQELKAAVEAQALKPFKDQLLLDITSEGLRIQIVDKENRPMFAQGSPVLESYTRDILHEIVKVIKAVPNRISIAGHTDQTPFASGNGYSNWELSADRANAARRELVGAGLVEEKIARVVGLSSAVLFDKQNAFSPVNRRISIIIMTKAAETAVTNGEGSTSAEELPPTPANLAAPAAKAGLDAAPETNAPETNAPETNAPETATPGTTGPAG